MVSVLLCKRRILSCHTGKVTKVLQISQRSIVGASSICYVTCFDNCRMPSERAVTHSNICLPRKSPAGLLHISFLVHFGY